MKLLITGGAGYIGTELTGRLVAHPEVEKIIIYDNLSRKNSNLFLGERFPNAEKIEFIHDDILNLRTLNKVLGDVDVVYHLAARVSTPFDNADADFHEQVNHWGTAELVSAVEVSDVKKFIFTSSASVYGASKSIIDEGHTPEPKTFYGISKLRAEKQVRRLEKVRNTLILRCANVYGYSKSMRFDAVINRFMFEANFAKKIQIHGNGRQFRAFVEVHTLVDALVGCLFNEVPSGIYNVVDKNLQIVDIVDALKEIYPSLEFIFLNQHLHLKGIRINLQSKLRDHVDYKSNATLKDELLKFKENFSF